ncbi:hypothetical protein Leryth_006936 [Lithospermum erythrorhizon]|nr:hypothetical protein Leryth_006936 [Lithospermum erythrorhizon]
MDMAGTEALVMQCSESLKPLLEKLPSMSYGDVVKLYLWEGFWYTPLHLEAAKSIQENFIAKDDDILLASSLKTGTTWLKSLLVCIMGPQNLAESDDPLIKNHPAAYVQTLETQTFIVDQKPDLSALPSPRLFHTHMAYNVLPDSVKNSGCKIVYIVRNPKDTFVSMWHFFNTVKKAEPGLFEMVFQGFCHGVVPFGPFFDHALQFWNESLKQPQKILFLKYEDLKSNPIDQVKKLADFLGRPFENDEKAKEVLERCSLDRLKNLEVNKNGIDPWVKMQNSSFFRLGVVGDSKNILTPEMQAQLDHIAKMKLEGSGLEI